MAYRNPSPTADIIIELADRPDRPIVLVERKNEPFGWAIPGGFIDYGETVETAARREAEEETGLKVTLTELLGVYSKPERDPRRHTMSVVYVATATGTPEAGDDAKALAVFSPDALPEPLCFDHAQIMRDYSIYRDRGERPALG
ncbi:MAG: NUDIX domain-containing protein [Geitlerinemataceae cyanobacterium]